MTGRMSRVPLPPRRCAGAPVGAAEPAPPEGPGSTALARTRLILCGSALSTMRGLLTGTAPLRGRASLELVLHPFGYRDAALFWQVAHDPELAVRMHALVGGTPAYRDMCTNPSPTSASDFDRWVVDNLLNPASAMFREGNALLSEEDGPVLRGWSPHGGGPQRRPEESTGGHR